MSERLLFWSTGPQPVRFLSAFHMAPFAVDNVVYPSLEHFFHAQKCLFASEFREVLRQPNPKLAKHWGHKVTPIPTWDEVKDKVMYDGTMEKFRQNPELLAMLKETGDRELFHFAPWGDTYWGVDKQMTGDNRQGKITMIVREELFK